MSDTLPDWKLLTHEERIEHVKNLVAQDYSCGMIARMFQNASRSAIIGLITRVEAREGPMKRARLPQRVKYTRSKPAAPRARKPAIPARERDASGKLPPAPVTPRMPSFIALPGVSPIPITELPHRQRCRWPVDVPEQTAHFACGAPTVNETHSYCAAHRNLSVRGASSQGAA